MPRSSESVSLVFSRRHHAAALRSTEMSPHRGRKSSRAHPRTCRSVVATLSCRIRPPRSEWFMRRWLSILAPLIAPFATAAAQAHPFTHADTLRGSNTPQRAWWDVSFYDLHVTLDPQDSTIRGWNGITYRVLQPSQVMQVDLQPPLVVDSIVQEGRRLAVRRDGDAFFVTLVARQRAGDRNTVTVHYHGKPVVAKRPPWDGGLIWATDSTGFRWVATANEGTGASIWWPNKDYLADEPDSQRIAITTPDSLFDVSNGRLRGVTPHADGTTTYEWFTTGPINN